MKTVFFDFDGVLHPSTAILDVDRMALSIDPLATIARHNLLRWAPLVEDVLAQCEQQTGEDYTIAVHSSWRKSSWATNAVIRQALGPLGRRFLGVTNPQMQRQESIADLCERCEITDYLIVDDDRSAFVPGTSNLVVTNPLLGMSDPRCLDELRRWATPAVQGQALTVAVP